MARGGKKATPGGMPAQAKSVGPSGEYGQGVASQRAMNAVPLPKMGGGPPSPQGSASPGAAVDANVLPPFVAPGSLGGILDPSGNPAEPITHGASFGPGADFNALPTPVTQGAQAPQVADAAFMVNYLPMLESLASSPGSSTALRAFVRKMRSSLPPNFDPTAVQTVHPTADQQAAG